MKTKRFLFEILKQDKNSRARLGLITTPHGQIQTPAFLPVATLATVKSLDPKDLNELGVEAILANTYHLHLRPGEKVIEKFGGLHQFMNFSGPIITDSGGFQVFSLGAGLEDGVGKIASIFSKHKIDRRIAPSQVKVDFKGVNFKSYLDGSLQRLTPQISIKIQEKLGADIILAFDECTSPLASYQYTKEALKRTHQWAKICLKIKKRKDQAIFGIVQGGAFKNLREKSAQFIENLDFDGIAIGGALGKSKKEAFKILDWVMPFLKKPRPRHLLGIGQIKDILEAVYRGIDLFDCVWPTRLARHGVFLDFRKNIDINLKKYKKEKLPPNKNCPCSTCQNFSRAYLHHLFKSHELLSYRLATIHNLYFMVNFMKKLRQAISQNKFQDFYLRYR